MTERDFAYWLQGFFEISGTTEVTPAQVAIIKEHLQLVFKKETKLTNMLCTSGTSGYVPGCGSVPGYSGRSC